MIVINVNKIILHLLYAYGIGHSLCQDHSPWASSVARSESPTLSNSAVLLSRTSPGEVLLTAYWGSNETHFLLQLEGRTLGWMAFGMSPTGRMDKSDVMFGWCEDSATSSALSAWQDLLSRMPTALFHPNSAPCYAQVYVIARLLLSAIYIVSAKTNRTHV